MCARRLAGSAVGSLCSCLCVSDDVGGKARDGTYVDELDGGGCNLSLCGDDFGDGVGGGGVEAACKSLELHRGAHAHHVEHAVANGLEVAVKQRCVHATLVVARARRAVGAAPFCRVVHARVDAEVLDDGPPTALVAIAVVGGEQVDVALNVERKGWRRVGRANHGEGLRVVGALPVAGDHAHKVVVAGDNGRVVVEREREGARVAHVAEVGNQVGSIAVVVLPQLDRHHLARVGARRVPTDGVALAEHELVVEPRRADCWEATEALRQAVVQS
eukprot:3522246-Pleurochrysis_carterae.AAC.1